ncbi:MULTISPECIES: hypothetical protein [Streptomycetaceae]|uniref:hypothetical protein n=1 Tax=Streptomycetaceae TaxID=2062 RepID=UPI000A3FF0E2|nr:hypothetical protein [Streptomyces sp. CB02056]
MDFTPEALAELARAGDAAALRQALPVALPWCTVLPDGDLDTLITELADTARGAVAPDDLAPVELLLTQWQHSAEVYADPALLAVLTREPEADLGPVPPPGADRRAAD